MSVACSPYAVLYAGVIGFILGLALGNGWIA